MKKKILSAILCVAILFNLQTFAYASKELDENQNAYKSVNSQIKELDNEISNLNNEIYILQDKIEENEKEIYTIEKELKTLEDKITKIENEIEENDSLLSLRIREMYKSGSFGNLEMISFLLESNSLTDAIDRFNAFNILINLDKSLIEENKQKIKDLELTSESISTKKDNLLLKNKEIEEDLNKTESKKDEIKTKNQSLTLEKNKILDVIKENEDTLVKIKIDIINSSSSTTSQIKLAINELKSLLPQLTTSSVILKVNVAIEEGEKKLSSSDNSSGGSTNDEYKETYTMEATAYYGHTITAMGTKPIRDPNGISTVAVDKNVIPLGTKLYIPNYGYAMAADTGGAIKGMKIDLFMNSREECYSFGRRNITVHILAYPGEW